MKAVEQGVYSLDSAEATRQELRETVRVPETRELVSGRVETQALYPPIGICGVQ
jgi:hypothetical protein